MNLSIMNSLPEDAEYIDPFLTGIEAQEFIKAFWREPTEDELEEVAMFFAIDYMKAERFLDPEMDEIEELIQLQKEKNEILSCISLTRVLELRGLNVLMFLTFEPSIYKTRKTQQLSLCDNFSRVIKKDGVMKFVEEDDAFLFDI